ncbi:MAG TPA: hypothetical protein VKA21_16300 [Candidatus Binatia bacterium]|nr:hypothetical protein [Candidatus Binatia bacterium]
MKSEDTTTRTVIEPTHGQWPRYFPRQLITPDELTLEQEYFRNRMRRHNRLLHGWGVVCGARVCCPPHGEPWKVLVTAGYVLGPYGDEIVIERDRCFDLRVRCVTGSAEEPCGEAVDPWCSDVYVKPETPPELFVAVRYKQVMTRPVRVQPAGCGCDETQCEYSRWADGYEICVLDECRDRDATPPPVTDAAGGPNPDCPGCPEDPWVVLARVVVDEHGVVQTIDNCYCRRLVVSAARLWWRCGDPATPCPPPEEKPEVAEGGRPVRERAGRRRGRGTP